MKYLKLVLLLLLTAGSAWLLFNPDRFGAAPPSPGKNLTAAGGLPIALNPIDCGRRRPTVVSRYGNNLLVAYKDLNLIDILSPQGERLKFFDPSPRVAIEIIDLHADSRNYIMVVDGKSGSVSVFDQRFVLRRLFPVSEKGDAAPVAVTSNRNLFYVSDIRSGKIRVFSREGVQLAIIPKDENQKLHPIDTLVTPDGLVLTSDLKSAKIKVYSCDGKQVYSFDTPPRAAADGPAFVPARMAFDREGRVHVLSTDGSAVAVFSGRGQFLFRYRKNSSPAADIAIVANRIYLADPTGHRLEVWKY